MKVLGFPVHIDRSWFIVVALMSVSLALGYFSYFHRGFPAAWYWGMGFVGAILFFLCVLLHELGHSVVARDFEIPVSCVQLFMFGGMAQVTHEAKSPLIEFRVAIAGPLVSCALAGACFWIAPHITGEQLWQVSLSALLRYLALANFALMGLNLLPGFPLDGGRILRAALWKKTGNFAQATRWASALGMVFGVGFAVFGLWNARSGPWLGGVWSVLLGGFLTYTALGYYRESRNPVS